MMRLDFAGNSKEALLLFPKSVVRAAGRQLNLIQNGREPSDWKPMPSIGKGVREIRIWDEAGTFRIIYVVKTKIGLIVLHAFAKKSQATSKRDIELARKRLKELT